MNKINNDLVIAIKSGDTVTFKALLLHPDCDLNLTNSYGATDLMIAAASEHALILELLLPVSNAMLADCDGWTALMYAAQHGHIACVQHLLPVSDALAQDLNGLTPLMHAASKGHLACSQLLLPVSDAFARSHSGATASSLARNRDYPLVANLIDSYTYAMSERALLHSSVPHVASPQPSALRV